jgi:hypothetical protein
MTVIHLMGVIGPPIGAALVNWISIQGILVMGTAVALTGALIFGYSAFQTGIRLRLQAGRQAVTKLAARARRPTARQATPPQEGIDRE